MTGFEWTKATIVSIALLLVLPVAVAVPLLAGSFGRDPVEPPEPAAEVQATSEQGEEEGEEFVIPEAEPIAPAPAPRPALPPLPQPAPAAPQPAVVAPPRPMQGSSILDVENRLVELSYLVGAVDGVMDQALEYGIMAFQKVEGLERTGQLNSTTLSRLQTASRPEPMFSSPPSHFEIDIPRQVVFVVRNGAVLATLPTSTGNNELFTSQGWTRRAVTPNGRYVIDFKRQGWRHAPLGDLYRPSYFNGGIAFHGSYSVPAHPASHGCVRLPMQFADWFADNAPIGSVVYVYGGQSGENPQPELDQDEPVVQAAAAPAPAAPAPAAPADEDPVGELIGGLLGEG